jgi:hypothetical protein
MTTSSKQNFLSIAAAGSALAPIKFGLGGVPFGNLQIKDKPLL